MALTTLACAGGAGPGPAGPRVGAGKNEEDEAEVTPGEDLMQEHGVVERIVVVYDAVALRLERGDRVDGAPLLRATALVRHFVEDYHEGTEEKFVFPRLQAAGREQQLVQVLLQQHQRGRQLTDEIAQRANGSASPELAKALRAFASMYRAHASREDTIIFPAFRKLMGRHDYVELGEQFEDREHQLLGEGGFEAAVREVAAIEESLGLADLASFTPG